MPLILLALTINHPRIFDEFGEILGLLRIDDAVLDRLRRQVIALLSADDADSGGGSGDGVLDSRGPKGHLVESLDAEALKRLDLSGVYDHAPYVGSDRSDEAAIEGWRETWRLHGLREIRNEIRRALSLLKGDPCDHNRQRVSALKALVAEGQNIRF